MWGTFWCSVLGQNPHPQHERNKHIPLGNSQAFQLQNAGTAKPEALGTAHASKSKTENSHGKYQRKHISIILSLRGLQLCTSKSEELVTCPNLFHETCTSFTAP